MHNQSMPFNSFNINLQGNQTCIFIFSERNTKRLNYTLGFVFNRVLGINFSIMNDIEEFKAINGFKINYSQQLINQSLQITPNGLLDESEITQIKPLPFYKNNLIYFYEDKNGELGFDLFSAVFYFISRYEEWQNFEPDQHFRFEASSSILFKYNFHLKPVVDYWILELKNTLKHIYPTIQIPDKKFEIISTIDVDNLYAFKNKNVFRIIGASIKDVLKFDIYQLKYRLLVLMNLKKDPFDIYESISEFCSENKIPLFYFFLFKTNTKYDRTVNPKSSAYKKVFSLIKNKNASVGLHPSYDSTYQPELMVNEVKDFLSSSNQKNIVSRQHYLRFDINITPKLLIKLGVLVDFTMGFASVPGFRAGTSNPFFYYDFVEEKEQSLLFVPFCAMDGAYSVYLNKSADEALLSMKKLATEVKNAGGYFITVFHERSFYNHLYKEFGDLYKKLHLILKKV